MANMRSFRLIAEDITSWTLYSSPRVAFRATGETYSRVYIACHRLQTFRVAFEHQALHFPAKVCACPANAAIASRVRTIPYGTYIV